MPSIAFVVSNDTSPLLSALCFARALEEHGYTVTIIGNDASAQRARRAGLRAMSYGDHEQWQFDSPEYYARLADLCGVLEDIQRKGRFDLALVDTMITYPFALGSLRAGLPVVRFSPNLGGPWSLAYPAISWPGLPHRRRAIRSAQALWSWYQRMRGAVPRIRAARRASTALGVDYDKVFRTEFAAHHARLSIFEYGPMLTGTPEVVAAPAALELPWLEGARDRTYIGACVDADRVDAELDWAPLGDGRPLVYCSFGTFSHEYPHARRVFSALVEHAGSRPDRLFVIHTGRIDLGDVPTTDNVLIRSTVPQLALLRRARVFITHGGMASVREACYFGVPMVVVPGWNDQYGNAARVAYHRLGITASPESLTAATFATALDEVCHPSYRQCAQHMQSRVVSEATCAPGAVAIARALDGRPRHA